MVTKSFTLTEAKAQGSIKFNRILCTYNTEAGQTKSMRNVIMWNHDGKQNIVFFHDTLQHLTGKDIAGHLDDYKILVFDDGDMSIVENFELEL